MKMTQTPSISIITNISPNHLDWHTDMNEYINAKRKIISDDQERTILNSDDEITKKFKTKNTIFFGSNSESDFVFDKEGIKHNGTLILKDDDILLPGIHNRANYTTAIAAVYPFISTDAIVSVAKTFGGVEHRIELVSTINGVTYYNSSIDSSPSRTTAALNSFKEKLIVIAGGYDKKIPLDSLGPLFEEKAKAVILMGTTGPIIEKILLNNKYSGTILHADTMKDAVKKASQIATNGDKVILSPAAASFDMYPNFVCRGNDFKNEVNLLK
jgi:UDP-N-acetylmuramoylalanine--D-glutamate ligase